MMPKHPMRIDSSNIDQYFSSVPFSKFWSDEASPEIKMHKIHAYPAKFPSLLVEKSLEFAKRKEVQVSKMADVFCGCGTTALEAQKNKVDFWGCDINPVATLISKVKSKIYTNTSIRRYFKIIETQFKSDLTDVSDQYKENDRLKYWFEDVQIEDLSRLLKAIEDNTPKGKYRDFFYCAFSNILKKSSRWLTKSIKPQVDPEKPISSVFHSFQRQVKMMEKANEEVREYIKEKRKVSIIRDNFLDLDFEPFIDMVVTSPPYVTSYEYADLHQLSTLWLGYVEDYRDLREGTIGSLYHSGVEELAIYSLPVLGKKIVNRLEAVDRRKSKMAAKYFIDISSSVENVHAMLNPGGIAVFVIGNTEYKGVRVDNARFLTHCMLRSNFEEIEVFKRKISSKILTPFRDKKGKFTKGLKKEGTEVYSFEYIVTGRK